MSFEWHHDRDTEVNLLNSTHHNNELITHFYALLQTCTTSQGIDAIGNYLRFLRGHVVSYFAEEERRMIANKYPLFVEHKAEHELFKEQVNQHYQWYLMHGVNAQVFAMTIRSSGEWLINHIYKTDQTMVAFLHDRMATDSSFFN